jgi:type I restriction enzyme S subunit
VLVAYSGGAATPIVNKSSFSAIRLKIPPPHIQKKIGFILSAYDDLIENNKRRIAILEKMAEEIYREWFVRMRFSSYAKATEDKPAESSPAGLPLGWSYVPIGEAVKFTGGGTPSTTTPDFWTDGDVNWFTPTDITGAEGVFLDESSDKCTELGVRHSSATMFPAYSLMMTSRATIGAIAINTKPACTNQGFITCIPNAQYSLPYLYHWLKLNKSYFEQISSGSTFLELIKSRFKKIPILTAPPSVMTRYTELSQPILNQVEKLLSTNAVLKKTRDLLLPRLISGKLSVEDLELPSNEKLTAVSSALPQQELAHA